MRKVMGKAAKDQMWVGSCKHCSDLSMFLFSKPCRDLSWGARDSPAHGTMSVFEQELRPRTLGRLQVRDAAGAPGWRREGDCRWLWGRGHPGCSYTPGWLASPPGSPLDGGRMPQAQLPRAGRRHQGWHWGIPLWAPWLLLVPNTWDLGCKGALF